MWSTLKRWGRGFFNAASQRLALYYVIGLVTFVVVAVLDWPGLARDAWADTFTVSAMAAAIAAGILQGGAFLVISAVKIHNERVRNEGRTEGQQQERQRWTDWQKAVEEARREGKPAPPSPAEEDGS